MTTFHIIGSIAAHLSLISLGIWWFIKLYFQLEKEITDPPKTELLLTFCIYGGLALITLHAVTWMWSGMASLGILAAIIVAPFIGLIVSFSLRKKRTISRYHKIIFLLGLLYIPIAGAILTGLYFIVTTIEGGNF